MVDNRPSEVVGERVGLLLESGSAAFQKKSRDALIELIKGGVTTMLVSHNLNAVKEICNRGIWLHNGGKRQKVRPQK